MRENVERVKAGSPDRFPERASGRSLRRGGASRWHLKREMRRRRRAFRRQALVLTELDAWEGHGREIQGEDVDALIDEMLRDRDAPPLIGVRAWAKDGWSLTLAGEVAPRLRGGPRIVAPPRPPAETWQVRSWLRRGDEVVHTLCETLGVGKVRRAGNVIRVRFPTCSLTLTQESAAGLLDITPGQAARAKLPQRAA